MDEGRYKLHYSGSIFWIVFWIIVFFPIALALLLTSSSIELGKKTYTFDYDGSRFWLCFWMLVFFPVAFALLFVNGHSVTVSSSASK